MVILTYRTHRVRVAPDTLIVFKPAGEEENDGTDGTVPSSFLSKVRTGLKEDHSMLAWANTGAWETVEAADEQTVREGDQFRIGFEPLFVDFTKKTSWFTVYFLLEVPLLRENDSCGVGRGNPRPCILFYFDSNFQVVVQALPAFVAYHGVNWFCP